MGVGNLREALAEAKTLGCDVVWIHGTGEVRVTHPTQPRPVRLNGRRKDTARILVTFLRRVREAREGLR